MRTELRKGRTALLDEFRLVAAFLVVAIHIGPFSCFSEKLDLYVTYGAGRLGVPYFLMLTGYFVLTGYREPDYSQKVWRMAGKLALIYLGATILYLPLSWYAGNLPQTPGEAFKWFFFDGTFYHLWYLPAAIAGSLLTAFLLRHLPFAAAGVGTMLLYLAGLLGDSWYGLAEQIPPLEAFYGVVFQISSHTRNGIFLAPVFLWMGVALADGWAAAAGKRGIYLALSAVSLGAMLAECGITDAMGWQRHNSMYLFLVPAMLCGFSVIADTGAGASGEPSPGKKLFRTKMALPGGAFLRKTAMWIYLLHPMCIVLVRGAAGILKMEKIMVENTICLYLEVSLIAFVAGCLCTYAQGLIRSWQWKGENRHVQKGESLDRD